MGLEAKSYSTINNYCCSLHDPFSTAVLTGRTFSGLAITGSDSIITVGCDEDSGQISSLQ